MVSESIQGYVDMAAGLTRATRKRAQTAARALLVQTGLDEVAADAGDRVSRLAEEVLAASRANRELLTKLVAAEVDKAATRLGFARSEELDDLRREISELRLALAAQSARTARPSQSEPVVPPSHEAAEAKRTATKKTAAKAARKATTSKAPTTKAPARKEPARKAPARKAQARKEPAKQTAAESTGAAEAAAQQATAEEDGT